MMRRDRCRDVGAAGIDKGDCVGGGNMLEYDFQFGQIADQFRQGALDKYGTKTYSGYSTVSSQLGYCDAASRIGQRAIFAARGSFTIFVTENLRELRNALILSGEQQFRFAPLSVRFATLDMSERCWDRRGSYRATCGMVYS